MLAVAVSGVLAIVVGLVLPPAALSNKVHSCDNGVGIYPANGTFQANLNLLAAALPANASAGGFVAATVGTAPDQVNALALCRGDVNATSCRACVAAAFPDAAQGCPGNEGVEMYEDACLLSFSSLSLLDFLRADRWQVAAIIWNVDQATGSVDVPGALFSAAVAKILAAVVDHAAAAAGNSTTTTRKYFATGEEDFSPRIYVLAQCLPDMSPEQCQGCLGNMLNIVTRSAVAQRLQWGRALCVWCNLMYSVRPFYEGRSMLQLAAPLAPAPVPPSAALEPGAGKKKSATGIQAGIACSAVLILILLIFAFVRFRRRTKGAEADHPLKKLTRAQYMIFELPALKEATDNFSENNKLGEGGFGTVYKGILSDGQEIAVKKLLGMAGHGLDELHNEVLLLAELQHKNLVRLHGFCLHRDETLLVYEYIKNGTLDSYLFDDNRGIALNWGNQFRIILGIAKGILYLHEDSSMRIIHRDLKANNILLDDDLEPKIADFGLARLMGEGHTHSRTARVVGTYGYMPPEYALDGTVSTKVDIFSFGVLILEIVTRRRNSSSQDQDTVNLLSDIWNCWTKGTISQIMDPSLDEYSRNQALRCIHIGLLCVQLEPNDRPHISSVIFMLTRDNMEFQLPAQPAFFFGRDSSSSGEHSYVYGRSGLADNSVNGITLTELYPR